MSAAVKKVAAALGNTAAVCRRSYIHPAIVKSYLGGVFVLEVIEETGPRNLADLTAEEAAVLSLLRRLMTGSGGRGAPMVREPTIEIVCERAVSSAQPACACGTFPIASKNS
jgi:hypothetical protein